MLGAQVFKESVSAVTNTPSVELGTVRYDGEDKYIYCYNASNSVIEQGACVTLSGVTGYSVTCSLVTDVGNIFGAVKNVSMDTGDYGWILKKGFTVLLASNTSITPGALATPDDGLNGRISLFTLSSGQLPLDIQVVQTLSTTGCAVTGAAYLDL